MKKLFFTLVQQSAAIFLAFAVSVQAQENNQPYIISPRLGAEIDSYERAYFHLLPRSDGFNSAQAFLQSDGQVALRVNRRLQNSTRDTIYTIYPLLAPPLVQDLQKFIEDFEVIYTPDNFTARSVVNFGLASYPAEKARRWKNTKVIVTMRDGQKQTGSLLFATDSSLAIWIAKQAYNWRQPPDSLRIFHASEIDRIFMPKKGSFFSGAGYGLLIGSGVGTLWNAAFPEDDAYLSFNNSVLNGVVFSGVPLALTGGIYGAVAGADVNIIVEGNASRYKVFASKLRLHATFPVLLPPELHALMKSAAE